MPTLASDYTYQFLDNGVTLNTDAILPFVDINSITGLDSAEVRVYAEDYSGNHGGHLDAFFLRPRTIILGGTVFAPLTNLQGFLDTLKGNFAPSTTVQPFYLKEPGIEQRVVFVKSLGMRYVKDQSANIGTALIQITLQAPDPHIYSDNLFTPSVGLANNAVGGRVYPRTYNRHYTATGIAALYSATYGTTYPSLAGIIPGGFIRAVNNGNAESVPIITIAGPCVNPRIENTSAGKFLRLNGNLGPGDVVTIDMFNHTILLNGTGNRRKWFSVGSSFWTLNPGTNYITFLADMYQPNALLTVSFRSAWN